MVKKTFGKTGYSVSPIGFGAAPVGYLKVEQERITRILNLLLDAGVNLIDTAASYPGSEQAIAKAVGHRRDEFVLVSKCGSKLPDVPGAPWSTELITGTVDRALRNLQTDHLDVMLLHSCDEKVLRQGDALAALVSARAAGKIRFAGYSGDNAAAAYAAELSDIAVIETSVSIADQANIDHVLPITQKHEAGVLAKRPIANAAWKDLSDQHGLYKSYAKTYHDRLKQMKLDPAELGFAGRDAWSELALRFTLSQPAVHCAIIGTTNPDNAIRNLGIIEKGPLSAEVVEKIRGAFRAADPAGAWMGQT
jgi:aryl-alcohol dehydrogenase-like predicted oxidoreductase